MFKGEGVLTQPILGNVEMIYHHTLRPGSPVAPGVPRIPGFP